MRINGSFEHSASFKPRGQCAPWMKTISHSGLLAPIASRKRPKRFSRLRRLNSKHWVANKISVLAFIFLFGCAHPPAAAPHPRFVDLAQVDGSIAIDIRYAGENNFVGGRIDGYSVPRCLLTKPAAKALAAVQRELETRGFSLAVYDCYRPQQAVDHFARWAEDLSNTRTKARHYPNVDKSRMFALGYIAEQSGHSRGSTVDVTLIKRGRNLGWAMVDMGTEYDFFDPASHTESSMITSTQRHNRLLLRDAMERGGFENFPNEWWHYTLRNEPYPDNYWDVVIR